MKILREIPDDEMIAAFLKAEIDSPRFNLKITPLLEKHSVDKEILSNPDLNDPKQNKLRRRILAGYRGYQKQKELFDRFPQNITWFRALITKNDLKKVKYLINDYWNELSNGKGYAKHGAKNVNNGLTISHPYGVDFSKIAEDLRNGKTFAELILVGKDEQDELVVLEGHGRITTFLLNPQLLPKTMEVIVGLSQDIGQWAYYRES